MGDVAGFRSILIRRIANSVFVFCFLFDFGDLGNYCYFPEKGCNEQTVVVFLSLRQGLFNAA